MISLAPYPSLLPKFNKIGFNQIAVYQDRASLDRRGSFLRLDAMPVAMRRLPCKETQRKRKRSLLNF
jgi:hypothetical protein